MNYWFKFLLSFFKAIKGIRILDAAKGTRILTPLIMQNQAMNIRSTATTAGGTAATPLRVSSSSSKTSVRSDAFGRDSSVTKATARGFIAVSIITEMENI